MSGQLAAPAGAGASSVSAIRGLSGISYDGVGAELPDSSSYVPGIAASSLWYTHILNQPAVFDAHAQSPSATTLSRMWVELPIKAHEDIISRVHIVQSKKPTKLLQKSSYSWYLVSLRCWLKEDKAHTHHTLAARLRHRLNERQGSLRD